MRSRVGAIVETAAHAALDDDAARQTPLSSLPRPGLHQASPARRNQCRTTRRRQNPTVQSLGTLYSSRRPVGYLVATAVAMATNAHIKGCRAYSVGTASSSFTTSLSLPKISALARAGQPSLTLSASDSPGTSSSSLASPPLRDACIGLLQQPHGDRPRALGFAWDDNDDELSFNSWALAIDPCAKEQDSGPIAGVMLEDEYRAAECVPITHQPSSSSILRYLAPPMCGNAMRMVSSTSSARGSASQMFLSPLSRSSLNSNSWGTTKSTTTTVSRRIEWPEPDAPQGSGSQRERPRGVLGFQVDDMLDHHHHHLPSTDESTTAANAKKMASDPPTKQQASSKQQRLRLRASTSSPASSSSPSSSYSSRPLPYGPWSSQAFGSATVGSVSAAKKSRVDSSVWKKTRILTTSAPPSFREGGDAAATPGGAGSGPSSRPYESSSNVFSTNVLLWFPWIPTRAQIASLTHAELQQVCSDRDLPLGVVLEASKSELQDRLWEWTVQQQERLRRQRRVQQQQHVQAHSPTVFPTVVKPDSSRTTQQPSSTREFTAISSGSPNSLAEWARTVDLEPLLQRREKIRQRKDGSTTRTRGGNSTTTDSLSAPAYRTASKHLSKLYAQAKVADQRGDIPLAKALLTQLVEEDPDDARLYRRLARLEKDQGNVAAATMVLQQGLRRHPKNAWLWHGLGQIAPNDRNRKHCYHRAIQLEPKFAFPYHALGTLEHTQGRIASAMKILKMGVYHCPTNHRLHHALGDLYRDAKMLEMAERSYKKALQHGPAVSHGFCYTALAYVAYEQGSVDKCRSWLLKAIALNNGRHANGWLSLAQLEESEGNTEGARSVCIAGATMYERSLIERHSRNPSGSVPGTVDVIAGGGVTRQAMTTVPTYRSGDRFYNLYRNWARLEERQGTRESAEEVYRRATAAFPGEWRLFVDWAQYYVKLHSHEAARSTFAEACARVGRRNAKPYRLYAAFEMGLGDYKAARKILFQGATALAQGDDGFVGNRFGLAELYYTWAVCEWHLNDLNRAETLFDHALRLTSSEEEGEFRSVTMYALARLYHYRGEHLLAQHCIGLCLVENAMPGGNAKIWELWFQVATSLGNRILAEKCQEQAERASSQDDSNELAGLSRLLAARSAIGSEAGTSRATSVEVERHMRRDPWHHKIFGSDLQHHETGSSDLGITLPAM